MSILTVVLWSSEWHPPSLPGFVGHLPPFGLFLFLDKLDVCLCNFVWSAAKRVSVFTCSSHMMSQYAPLACLRHPLQTPSTSPLPVFLLSPLSPLLLLALLSIFAPTSCSPHFLPPPARSWIWHHGSEAPWAVLFLFEVRSVFSMRIRASLALMKEMKIFWSNFPFSIAPLVRSVCCVLIW